MVNDIFERTFEAYRTWSKMITSWPDKSNEMNVNLESFPDFHKEMLSSTMEIYKTWQENAYKIVEGYYKVLSSIISCQFGIVSSINEHRCTASAQNPETQETSKKEKEQS